MLFSKVALMKYLAVWCLSVSSSSSFSGSAPASSSMPGSFGWHKISFITKQSAETKIWCVPGHANDFQKEPGLVHNGRADTKQRKERPTLKRLSRIFCISLNIQNIICLCRRKDRNLKVIAHFLTIAINISALKLLASVFGCRWQDENLG